MLDASTNAQTREALAVELSFLTGDASTREKVRRMLNPATNNNNVGQIGGLFIARNRSLVLQLLEAGIRDPKITVDSSLLWDVSRIRFLRETSGLPRSSQQFSVVGLMPSEDPRMQQIRDSYLTELVAGLSKRTGKNQTTTAMTILMNLPKDAQASDVMLREIRQVLIPQFDTLHPFTQEALLSRYWDQLRDPSLVPSMKKLLSYEGVANKNIHDASLKRLIEMSPEDARPFVVAEIRNPRSLVDREILAMISDRSLPEVDESLLAQVRQLANSSERSAFVYMDYKTSLLARFASDSIYQDLIRLYGELGEGVSIESRAGMVAYFASHNGDEATPLIDETISKLDAQKASRFLTKLTAFFYSDEIGKILKKRLESDVPEEASTAAYLIGKHGAADDQKNLEARLRRWRDEWGRIEEGNNDLQGTIEREVVYALIHGQGWKLTPDRIRELQLGCISKYCRMSNQLK